MKSNLYTRTGDAGTTSLVDGSRASKDTPRVDAYGDIDELSSSLGLLASSCRCPEEIRGDILHIQHLLFDIGGYLATPSPSVSKTQPSEDNPLVRKLNDEIPVLEGWIDSLDERTPKIRNFILPGGSEESSRCHMARTVCRRAERKVITLSRNCFVDPTVISYLNRLSDFLFITARYLNFITGVEEIIWKP